MRTTSPGIAPPSSAPPNLRRYDERSGEHNATPRTAPVSASRTADVVEVSGAAFESFYRRHRPALVRAVAVTVSDIDLATEAVDEAMVRAYQRWNTVGDLDQPAGWVYRVAVNHCRSRLRRVARKLRYTSALPQRDAMSDDVAFADRISDGRVLQALQSLPFDQRAVIVTRVLMCLSESEAAELLDTKPGTIKSRLSRALTTLRKELPEYASEWSALADSSTSTTFADDASSSTPFSHNQESTS